jgi:AcrR family transcriptional regulator
MAHCKLLSTENILNMAVQMVEKGEANDLSLRAIAASLGVKAPSLYRYFQNKDALELAVAVEALERMKDRLKVSNPITDPKVRILEVAQSYLEFAREHYALYAYVFQGRVKQAYHSHAGKAVWNLLLTAVSDLTGVRDNTGSTVAIWSFLHGYATLEHAGGFGPSGPRDGFELGLNSFMCTCQNVPNNSRPSVKPARHRR